ncbi:MAG: hypothetical protein ACLFWF_10415 [Alphaproteobacteria bacterium]
MARARQVFNASMALGVRALAAGLIFAFWDLPYREALMEPGAAFAADTVRAGLALLMAGFFGALVLSGFYVFIRMLTGADLLADPVHWREQVIVRRGIRLALFLILLVFWTPEFLSIGEWIAQIRAGRDLGLEESLGVIWVAATAYFAVSFLLGAFGPVPAHVRHAAAGGDWLDFLEDFLPGGDAYAPAGGGSGGD